jgi:hypothetical protein
MSRSSDTANGPTIRRLRGKPLDVSADHWWHRSSKCSGGDCVVVALVGRVVMVRDSMIPLSVSPGQAWEIDEWWELLAALKAGTPHPGVDPIGISRTQLGLDRHEPLVFRQSDWWPFVEDVKAGGFTPDKLSSPVSPAGGSESTGRQVGSVGVDGSDPAATGAGLPSGQSAPVAASLDVPVGRLNPASPDAGIPPQEDDRPGPAMWVLAEQPGRDVTAVRDHVGDRWKRLISDGPAEDDVWDDGVFLLLPWVRLIVEFGPLTDATEEARPPLLSGVPASTGPAANPCPPVVAGLKGEAGPVSNTPGTGPAEPEAGL